MPFANSGDSKINPKEGSFEEFPEGNYTMTGIDDFFSRDDQDLPIFKPIQNDLKAHCHFKTAETLSQQPAWTGVAHEYVQLAKALGANVEGLRVSSDTEFLMEIQKRINAAKPSTGIYVGKRGWVSKINALLPPTGFYRVVFRDAFSLDKTEPISFQEKDNPFENGDPYRIVRFLFEIISDVEDGTEYAGTTFVVDVHDPFDGVFNNMPSWKHAKNGGMLIGQRRLMTFLNIFWPEVEDYQWVVDPERSEYGINEAANPIVVIVDQAKRSTAQALTRIEVTNNGFVKMDLQDLSPTKTNIPVTVKPVNPPLTKPMKAQSHLVKVINDNAFPVIGENAISSTGENLFNLTTKGAEWCKENVAPIWDSLEFGEPRKFDKLTEDQAQQLADAITAKFATSEF